VVKERIVRAKVGVLWLPTKQKLLFFRRACASGRFPCPRQTIRQPAPRGENSCPARRRLQGCAAGTLALRGRPGRPAPFHGRPRMQATARRRKKNRRIFFALRQPCAIFAA